MYWRPLFQDTYLYDFGGRMTPLCFSATFKIKSYIMTTWTVLSKAKQNNIELAFLDKKIFCSRRNKNNVEGLDFA